ncbi:MAG: acetyl-CoA carboxylase biotin carboxylase subunit [Nitrospinae bacterium]|nr:acetyl-CoA carboxylase biotin carboxylase subunit [Nitrospinota bacterium]
MFKKVLIANRGEIALRIIRACKELGIKTVSIHSTVDADSLHVRFSDESYCIGPAESSKSYLNIPAIISTAEVSNADAIHPGYGFLAENPDFAEICENCNIKFIGPPSGQVRAFGNKAKAKSLMEKFGVPIIRGYHGDGDPKKNAQKLAAEIGYPLLIKAAAGGGGRGMRIARNQKEFEDYLQVVRTEAELAFGNGEVYFEKYLQNPKHIEIQVLCDEYGNGVHLGERECSIQRRHQKLLEEAPCSILNDSLRKKMGAAAVNALKSNGYKNAGTVEFLLDENGDFFFIEVNTRIQVEHPITEQVTGIDLIKEQIKIAAGEKLQFTQDDIKIKGHSIQCRVNAEHPETFVPSPGKITSLNIPGGPGVRVDTGIYGGYQVLPFYDSLIAKLIVYEKDRPAAIAKLRWALEEFHVGGIHTSIPFHLKVINHPQFLSGNYNTGFLDSNF